MAVPAEKLHILYLEDEPLDIELALSTLKQHGYAVEYTHVDNKKDFLSALEHQKFDLILADYNLPAFDGMSALKLFQRLDLDIPFILVSGTLGEERAIESLKAGAVDYVLKTGLNRLGPVVERALREAEEHRQRRQAEAALQQNQHQLQLLLDNTIDVIWQMDPKLNFTYLSPSIQDTFGYTVEEATGSNLAKFATPKEFLKMARQAFGALKEYRTFNKVTFQAKMLHKDGREIPVEINGRLLLNEKGFPYGLQGSTRDISSRIEAQRKLKESEERFRILYNESPDMYTTIEAGTGKILMCNQTLLDETGFIETEVIGIPIYKLCHYESLRKAKTVFETFYQTGRIRDEELILRRIDGTQIPVSLNIDAIRDEEDRILYGICSWRDITQRLHLQQQAQRYLNQQVAANELALGLGETLELSEIYQILYKHVQKLMDADGFGVSFYDPKAMILRAGYIISEGQEVDVSHVPQLALQPEGKGFQSDVIRSGQYRYVEDFQKTIKNFNTKYIIEKNGSAKKKADPEEPLVQSALFAPMKRRGETIGVMSIQSYHLDAYSQDDIDLFSSLANVASISIQNAELFKSVESARSEIAEAYDSTLEGWAKALELRDMETEGHSRRVVDLTVKLAMHMGLNSEELTQIQRGALLHDIGKMSVPDAILQKPGKLSDDEWNVMRLHPVYAYRWLSPIKYLRPCLDIPRFHHEHWDGSGYPTGLQGDSIPLPARIFAIIDVWDALLSDRPYREAWSKERAIEYIKYQSGQHFDPRVVKAFLEMIENPEKG